MNILNVMFLICSLIIHHLDLGIYDALCQDRFINIMLNLVCLIGLLLNSLIHYSIKISLLVVVRIMNIQI